MRLIFPTLVLAFFVSLQASSQEYLIRFLEMEHDFGTIIEEDGPVYHRFLFYNAGEKSLTISEVTSSCGCTTPAWTEEEVMPGDTGFVDAKFDPAHKIGNFKKSLKITSNSDEETTILKITGRVEKRPILKEIPKAKFDRFFTYDKKVIQPTEEMLANFMDTLQLLADAMDTVKISIESSASFVPTHRYPSNEVLAQKRGEDTRDLILAQAKLADIDTDKLVFTINSYVQGPKYHNDAQERIKDYEKWQYVKVWTE